MLRLRDDQWERIREHFPEEHIPEGRPGRKPVPARAVLEAVLWILNTGAQWHMLPQCYPNYKTVHRRFQQWCERAVLRDILTQLANTLREDGALDERESFIDATFASAKGGATTSAPPAAAKALRSSRSWIVMGCRSREYPRVRPRWPRCRPEAGRRQHDRAAPIHAEI
jgi:transposase